MKKKIFALLLSLTLIASSVNIGAAETAEESGTEVTASENSEELTVQEGESDPAVLSTQKEASVSYPDAISSNHTFVTKKSAYKSGTWMLLVPGKSVKFDIGDASGKKIKGAAKSAVWSVSGDSSFTVKKGRVKLNKNAKALGPGVSSNTAAASALISAEYDGETIYIGMIAVTKTKYVGYLEDAKLKNKGTVIGKVGSTFDLRNLNSMIGQDVVASYKVEKSGIKRNYLYFATQSFFANCIERSREARKNFSNVEVYEILRGGLADEAAIISFMFSMIDYK